MTDNEIIEGLKLCTNEEEKYCKGCPFIDEMNCVNSLTKHALDLIKRKDEQIEALIAGQETLQKYIAEKDAEIEKLRSQNLKQSVEIDTLRNSAKTSTIIIENLENKSKTMTTEVERLSNINQKLSNINQLLTNTRTEAVKELIEKLTEEYAHYNLASTISIDVLFCDIKRIAKEMVGE